VETGAAFQYLAACVDALLREQRREHRGLVGETAVDRFRLAAFERHLPCPRALHQRKTERAVHALRREAKDPSGAGRRAEIAQELAFEELLVGVDTCGA